MAENMGAQGHRPDTLLSSKTASAPFSHVIKCGAYTKWFGYNAVSGVPSFGDVNIGAAVSSLALNRFMATKASNLVAMRFGTGQQVLTAATTIAVTVGGTAYNLVWNATNLQYELTSAPLAALLNNAGACVGIASITKIA